MRAVLLRLVLALSFVAAPALARPMLPPPGPAVAPTWAQLSEQEQADLVQLERRWDRLPPHRRLQILKRHARWARLPPEEREALREGRRNYQELSPKQRERMRGSMEALRQLPKEEQRRLRALWRDMTPEERRQWLRRGGPGVAPPPQQQ